MMKISYLIGAASCDYCKPRRQYLERELKNTFDESPKLAPLIGTVCPAGRPVKGCRATAPRFPGGNNLWS